MLTSLNEALLQQKPNWRKSKTGLNHVDYCFPQDRKFEWCVRPTIQIHRSIKNFFLFELRSKMLSCLYVLFSRCEERLQYLWACGSALVFLFPPCACETEDFFTLIFSQCTSSHDKCKKKFGKGTMCWNSLWKGKPGTRTC